MLIPERDRNFDRVRLRGNRRRLRICPSAHKYCSCYDREKNPSLAPFAPAAPLRRRCPARAAAVTPEYVILVGGPSLMQWEKYKAQPHDHWWANFVRAGRIRTEQLRAKFGPDAKITWLVYKQGYVDRGAQEKKDLIAFIDSVRDAFNLNLVYFQGRRRGDQLPQ